MRIDRSVEAVIKREARKRLCISLPTVQGDIYQTGCGRAVNGGELDGYDYCPFCGRPIAVIQDR